METSFYSDTNEWALGFISRMFRDLAAGGAVTALGILALTAALCFLAAAKNRKKAYLHSDIGRIIWHWLLIPTAAGSAVLCLIDPKINKIIGALLTAAAVFAACMIIKKKLSGPVAAAAVIWASVAAYAAGNISAAAEAGREMAAYSAIGKFSLYGAADILIMRSLGLCLITAAVTAMYVRYYVRNRYLLLSGYISELKDADRCSCGYPFLKGNEYCPVCGKKTGPARTSTELEILDDPVYCVRCSRKLNKQGICPDCGDNSFGKALKHEGAEALKSNGIKIGAFVVIALFVLIPSLAGNLYKGLSSGVDQAVRNFETKTVEYINDPSVRQNETWSSEFTDLYNAVYDADLRIFDVYLRRIGQEDLKYYIQFGEQAFSRECLMENLWYAVKGDDVPLATELIIAVDSTRVEQENALKSVLGDALSMSESPVSTFVTMLTDGFRFYTSFIPLWLFGALLILASAGIYALARHTAKKQTVPVPAFDTGAGTGVRTAYTPNERKAIFIAVVAVILIFAVSAGIQMLKDRNAGPDFGDSLRDAVMDKGTVVLTMLSDRDGLDDGEFKEACEAQILALEELMKCEPDGAVEETVLEDVPELIDALTALAENGAGDADSVSRYVSAQMKIMQTEVIYNIDAASDTISDMF